MDVQLEDVRVGARRWFSIRRRQNDKELIERDVGIRSGAARVCTNVGHVSVVVTATTLDLAAVTITDSAAVDVALAGISLNRPRRRHRARCVLHAGYIEIQITAVSGSDITVVGGCGPPPTRS